MMNTVVKIRGLFSEADRLDRQADRVTKSAVSLLQELQKEIGGGSTTGDLLLDTAIVCDGNVSESFVDRYRQLDRSLVGNKGQLVLVVTAAEKPTMPPHDHYVEEKLAMGILGGERLVHQYLGKSWAAGIPLTEYAVCDISCGGNSYPATGPFFLWGERSIRGLNEPLECVERENRLRRLSVEALWAGQKPKPYRRLEIVVGNHEVQEWIVRNNRRGAYEAMKGALGGFFIPELQLPKPEEAKAGL